MDPAMPGRIWFWRPQLHWFGWGTLSPVYRGGDEYGRRTVVLGWTITGRVIIAYRVCHCAECAEARTEMLSGQGWGAAA